VPLSQNDDVSVIKRQFLASLNHEIRTPLSGILGMSDLLLETSLSADQKEYVDATRTCAENLLQLLNGALEYSALSANHVRAEETEFPLRETLNGVLTEFVPKAEAKSLTLIRNFDPRLPEAAIGDAVRLRQLLVNLLSNAVKFTEKGEIEMAVFASQIGDNALSLSMVVRDTGIGIPPDRVRSIFDGFQRLQYDGVSDLNGLGLGLAVSQKLAMLLNGSITVQSELGRGSTFFVDISLRLPVELPKPEAERERSPIRVLVVDDNSIAQTVASHALRRRDYEVQCAGDGLEALEAASRVVFDVILLDLQMPGMDGFQTAERLRKMPQYVRTPIVAVTANCSDADRERCRMSGMQGFLAKPVAVKDLVQMVEQYCASLALHG
jgi:two-component system, sensor histidine kinase